MEARRRVQARVKRWRAPLAGLLLAGCLDPLYEVPPLDGPPPHAFCCLDGQVDTCPCQGGARACSFPVTPCAAGTCVAKPRGAPGATCGGAMDGGTVPDDAGLPLDAGTPPDAGGEDAGLPDDWEVCCQPDTRRVGTCQCPGGSCAPFTACAKGTCAPGGESCP